MASARTKRHGSRVSTMSVKDLQTTVKSGGVAGQKARNELVKRGEPVQTEE